MKRIFITTLLISLIGLLNLTAQERIYIPELSLPADGAADQMPDVVLDWNAVTGGNTGIIKYDIQLDTDPAFPSPVNFQTELLSAYQASLLLFGQVYYWHVRATDGNEVSGWSETWSFRIIQRVILNTPDDAALKNTEVDFEWDSISGITAYELQIDTSHNWNVINSGQNGILYEVDAVDETHAWIAGAAGVVLFYDGTSWVEQESHLSTDLYSLSFVDANNGWAVGKGGKIIHYDGTAWAAQANDSIRDLNGVYMLDANNGWTVGKNGILLHYNGSTWSPQYHAAKELTKVYAVDATHVWAVGKGGFVAFYNGSSWSVQPTGITKDINAVAFTSPDHGWAAGKGGLLMEYKTGTWKVYDNGETYPDLFSLNFTSADNAWAVGKSGFVLQYDGREWFSHTAGTNTTLNGVAMAGTTGFIAGEAGILIKYKEGAFDSPFLMTINIPGESLTTKVINLPFGEQLFWRMRTMHSLATSDWSGASSFDVQATVILDSPDDGDTKQNLNVLLTWKKYSDLVTYQIEIDDDPAFGTPISLASNEKSINAEQLKFGEQYSWRVRALQIGDISDWSDPWTFTTVNSVTLTSPVNNAIDVGLSPLLNWVDITGITGYSFQVSETADFTTILADGTAPAELSQGAVPIILEKGVKYFWRVRAENGLDFSGWSPTWAFTTLPPVGIGESTFGNKLSIYPNPADKIVNIKLKEDLESSLQFTVTDLVGKKVLDQVIHLDSGIKNIQVDVSTLKEGIYMLRMSDQHDVFTKKLIIKR